MVPQSAQMRQDSRSRRLPPEQAADLAPALVRQLRARQAGDAARPPPSPGRRANCVGDCRSRSVGGLPADRLASGRHLSIVSPRSRRSADDAGQGAAPDAHRRADRRLLSHVRRCDRHGRAIGDGVDRFSGQRSSPSPPHYRRAAPPTRRGRRWRRRSRCRSRRRRARASRRRGRCAGQGPSSPRMPSQAGQSQSGSWSLDQHRREGPRSS